MKEERKPVYLCKLQLISLDKFKARFRVVDPNGWNLNFHHLDVARVHFPTDDDFNMDFINADVDQGRIGDPGEPVDEKDIKDQKKAQKAKQKEYGKFTEYTLIIE